MTFSINDIKSQLTGEGARQNLFQIQITNPVNPVADLKLSVMANAASLPASTLGTIEIGYFGRKLKVAGDRTFRPWAVNIINDEDFLIRNAMEEWSNSINKLEGNVRTKEKYKSDAIITQFSKDGKALRVYRFVGLWPANIGQIDVSWDANDQIETFPVEFEYDYWTVDGATGDAGGA